MAITKPTPRDIGTYEPKLIGPFTQRQVVCIGISAVPALIVAFMLKSMGFDGYTIAVFVAILMIPGGILAFGSSFCNGMKPEDFLLECYYYHIKSSNKRLYQTVTLDDTLDIVRKKEAKKEIEKIEGKKKEPKQKKKETVTKTKFKDERFTPYAHKKNATYREIS